MTVVVVPDELLPLIDPNKKPISYYIKRLPQELKDHIYSFTNDFKKEHKEKLYKVNQEIQMESYKIRYGYFFSNYFYTEMKRKLIDDLECKMLRIRRQKKIWNNIVYNYSYAELTPYCYKKILNYDTFERKNKVCKELQLCFEAFTKLLDNGCFYIGIYNDAYHKIYDSLKVKSEKQTNLYILKHVRGLPKHLRKKNITAEMIKLQLRKVYNELCV